MFHETAHEDEEDEAQDEEDEEMDMDEDDLNSELYLLLKHSQPL